MKYDSDIEITRTHTPNVLANRKVNTIRVRLFTTEPTAEYPYIFSAFKTEVNIYAFNANISPSTRTRKYLIVIIFCSGEYEGT